MLSVAPVALVVVKVVVVVVNVVVFVVVGVAVQQYINPKTLAGPHRGFLFGTDSPRSADGLRGGACCEWEFSGKVGNAGS